MKKSKLIMGMLGVFFLAFVFICAGWEKAKADTNTVNIGITGLEDYDKAYEVLELVNQERAKEGLAALTMDASLLEAAMQRASEQPFYFSHTRPDGQTCFTAFTGGSRAENIAWNQASASAVMNSWMNSEGHKKNIMGKYTSIGIGCFYYDNSYYWVQVFSDITPQAKEKPANQNKKHLVACDLSLNQFVIENHTEGASANRYEIAANAESSFHLVCSTNAGSGVYKRGVYTDKDTTWDYSLSDTSMAVIVKRDENGVTIQGKKSGTVTLTAMAQGTTQVVASQVLTVSGNVTGISKPEASPLPSPEVSPTPSPGTSPTPAPEITIKPSEQVEKPAKVKIKSVKAKKGGKVIVKCKAVSGADGYQISYAKNKKFRNDSRISNLTPSATIKGNGKKKTYYIRVRAYVWDNENNEVYGKWSNVKKVKTK